MATRKNSRGTTLLVILQAWILPCHGFAFMPHGLGCSSAAAGAGSHLYAARQQPSFVAQPAPLKAKPAVSRGTLPSLRMSQGGEFPFDPYGDEPPPPGSDMDMDSGGTSGGLEAPGPYRDEHTPGGSRFKELLARAKGEGAPPPPTAKPRRVLPPEGAPDYDDDSQWEQQAIGSPQVPDPPLRQEMPGLDLGPELGGMAAEGEAGGSGGSRFSRMMNQAKQNDERQEAGMAPRASPRSPQEVAKRSQQRTPVSKEEKEKAIRDAVERQQKLMAKSRGIDLDDPTLDGAELARKKALSRAQAESQAGGYVPSSSAADDYLNALKADSQRKQVETQARLRGKPAPPREEPLMSASEQVTVAADMPPSEPEELPAAEEFQPVRPQRRTQATWSVQNKADAYMASLKGIKVDLAEDNPYLKKESLEEIPPQQRILVPPAPPERPLGPKMTYAERLKLAKQAKDGSSGSAASDAATAPVTSDAPSSPEKPKAAPEVKVAATPPPPPPSPPAAAAISAEQATTRLLEHEVPEGALLGEDDAKAKMVTVMDLLTEHKKAGLVGEERVEELRSSLVDAREFLRAETYGAPGAGGSVAPPVTPPSPPPRSPSPPPPPPPQQQQQAQPQAPPPPPPPQQQQRPPAPPTATTSAEDAETLRRCSALLQAHVHSSLAGEDLQALVKGLTSSLAIVTAQVVATIAAAGGVGSGSSSSELGAPPAATAPAPNQAAGVAAVPDYVGGVQSIGGVLSDMGVGERPASFLPEDEGGDAGEEGSTEGWTGGSLGEDEKAVATKALGYLLKHRGGKGYGRGRVKGAEAEAMVATLAELTEILQDEMVEE
eukprot:g2707.t1